MSPDFPSATLPRNMVRSHHALRRMELTITRRLDGLLHGEHLGRGLGQGSETAEARAYQPGQDDVRLMDWALTARTTTAHVRDLVADRELESWTLLDLSPSMNFGTAAHTKREVALGALVAVNALTQRGGDRLGLHVLHAGGHDRYATRSGPQAVFNLLHRAHRTTQHPPNSLPPPTDSSDTDLARALHDLTRQQRRRGLRVIISDFLTPHTWEPALRQLTQHHQVLAIEILDPRELDIPNLGWITLRDPETRRVRDVYISAHVRHTYRTAALHHRETTHNALRRTGALHLVLRTDRDWIRDIAAFVARQRRVAHLAHRTARAR
ncbi:DUF58 domain-containing protein [Lipingzhangella sp. LS1_29]|uniref:DUF58 domain-containing protein n=1 Tax=Lipingzhangella rawalii TaxID=2055835 RepID=A0ABU2H2V0_9ACTN|nr:DUF58 domain-containing protein [Lipingzhangella rawalii]MDS1269150.1 DUF58 domain-containing protein [Lipingzhangella rawalii]